VQAQTGKMNWVLKRPSLKEQGGFKLPGPGGRTPWGK